MKTEMLSTRIDTDTKIAFSNICEEIGISTSQAISIFAKAVINHGGIPFELKVRQPNKTTAKAIAELESGKGKRVNTVEELFDELEVGDIKL